MIPYVALILASINLFNIGIDYTAIVLPPCIFLINMALVRYNFLEIKLMARERLFEDSNEGLIILNKNLYIMDFNQASERFFCWMNITLKPERLDLLIENNADLLECVRERKEEIFEFIVEGKEKFMSFLPKEICNKEETVGILVVMQDVTERELINRKLLEMARTDELSGLYNRRYFVEQTQTTIERAKRYGEDLSVIMIDVDEFKRINDNYGHNCGDEVIRAISDLLKTFFRESDIIGRVGGEEFAIVMLKSRTNEAYDKAEQLRIKVEEMNFEWKDQRIPVTISLGIAELESHRQSLDELVSCSDDALYKSKQNGRNRTTIYKK